MKLNYDRKSKDPTYFIQQGYRNGKKTSTRNVKRIGKHSELLLITDDPLEYAKKQVKLYNEEYKEGKVEMTLKIDFSRKLPFCDSIATKSTQVNIGYFILQKIYYELNLHIFFESIHNKKKVVFDCNNINRFLVYDRILNSTSKLAMFNNLDSYYEKPDFQYQHILRYMDILEENYDDYIEYLYENSKNIVKRNTSICYFDCTNYYFESEHEDIDYVDAITGEIIKGLRFYGVSKQHQPSPLVQMGLFMDQDGIPLSMCINPGSDNEQQCAIPLEGKLIKMFKNKKFIYCADAGLGSYNIRVFNSLNGRAFVVTQSVKKLSKALQEAVFNDYDYKRTSNDQKMSLITMKNFDRYDKANLDIYTDSIYKIIIADKAVDVGLTEEKTYKNGNTRKVKSKAKLQQKVIIIFSRKTMEYQRYVRNKQIERATKLLNSSKPEDIKKGPNDVKRFIKRKSVDANGEKAEDTYVINQELIEYEEKYDGFYAIATNLDDDVKTILDINSKRYKIEDCFRILKTNFKARPVFHRNAKRIRAHFMICYTALLVFRLLEKKLDNDKTHFTAENILETLKNMNIVNNEDLFYTASYTGSQVCTALNEVFDLGLDKKNYQPKELNKKLKKILK